MWLYILKNTKSFRDTYENIHKWNKRHSRSASTLLNLDLGWSKWLTYPSGIWAQSQCLSHSWWFSLFPYCPQRRCATELHGDQPQNFSTTEKHVYLIRLNCSCRFRHFFLFSYHVKRPSGAELAVDWDFCCVFLCVHSPVGITGSKPTKPRFKGNKHTRYSRGSLGVMERGTTPICSL